MSAAHQGQESQVSSNVTTGGGDQSSESTFPQSHFHRAQSVTSAVDYEYFDVGIGQVMHPNKNTI